MKKRWKISLAALILAGISGAVFAFTGCTIFGCKNQFDQLAINSFEECVDAGYIVLPTEPARCIIDKYHIYTEHPAFIKVESPTPFEIVASPLLINGQARALNNTINYRLQSNDNVVLKEGSFSGNSPEHGQWGEITIAIDFDLPSVPSGTLYLFEYGQDWDSDQALRIPLNFSTEAFPSPEHARSSSENLSEENGLFDPLQTLRQLDIPEEIALQVPFTPQAPFADWSEPYNEACEEASLIMVDYYLKDLNLSRAKADLEIVNMVRWQTEQGYFYDITVSELAEVAQRYLGYQAKVYEGEEVTLENIKRLLSGGYPVIIPAAGQLLGNPNFRGAGPPYHMLVITGYSNGKFITNDPGTRNGEDFSYDEDTILNVIHDWTGDKDTIQTGRKAILVIGKK